MTDPLGVDYGSRRIAVVHSLSASTHVIRMPPGDDMVSRQLLAEWLYGHVLSTKPGIVAVESPIVGASRNYRTGIGLAMMAGALTAAAGAAGAQVVLVAPSAWKKQVVGRGNASKDEVAEWLEREQPVRHGRCDADQDLIDATCISLYAAALLEGVSPLLRDDGGPVLRRKRRAADVDATDRDGQSRVQAVPGTAGLLDLRAAKARATRGVGRDGAA